MTLKTTKEEAQYMIQSRLQTLNSVLNELLIFASYVEPVPQDIVNKTRHVLLKIAEQVQERCK